jgi:addiction module RelE/StbE family toxin
MVEIAFSPSFIKNFKKRTKNNKIVFEKFAEKLNIFKNDPFDPRLKTHKLTGELKDLYSYSIDYDLRIIFCLYESNKVIFTDIGTHDEVY